MKDGEKSIVDNGVFLRAFRELAREKPYGWKEDLAVKTGFNAKYIGDIYNGRHSGGVAVRTFIAAYFSYTLEGMLALGSRILANEKNKRKMQEELERFKSECEFLFAENIRLKKEMKNFRRRFSRLKKKFEK